MICPRCGGSNQDEAGECTKCFYKFRFGYGYDDPAHSDPWALLRISDNISDVEEEINPAKSKIIYIGLVLIAIIFIGPMIILSLINFFNR